MIPVSVVIVTHNSAPLLERLLGAIASEPEGPDEIIVVDNSSSDDTEAVARNFGARWIETGSNLGFGAACNRGVELARNEIVVILNPDTVPRAGWLQPLAKATDNPGIGAVMATVELLEQPGRFNTSGGALTYFGLCWATDLGEPIPEESPLVDVAYPSGAAMAITREVFRQVGGFREDFFLYHEDADLGWRLRLLGYRIVRVAESRVAHDYAFARNPSKMFHLERNRIQMLVANYRWSTLLCMLPILLLIEAGVTLVAVRDGWFGEKWASWGAVMREWSIALEWHRQVQAMRRVPDSRIIAEMSSDIGGISQIPLPSGTDMVTRALGGYQSLVLPLVKALEPPSESKQLEGVDLAG